MLQRKQRLNMPPDTVMMNINDTLPIASKQVRYQDSIASMCLMRGRCGQQARLPPLSTTHTAEGAELE